MAGAVAGAVLGAVPGVSSTYRCFVDAAFAPDSGRVAFGCALFSATNCFLAAINGELLCSPDPLMAEAMACREALSWIKTLDIHNVEILMDCQRVVSAISDTSFSLTSYFGSLIVEWGRTVTANFAIATIQSYSSLPRGRQGTHVTIRVPPRSPNQPGHRWSSPPHPEVAGLRKSHIGSTRCRS
ncbi:unnamed protein product [Cuscuta campestris]|uniref:RNase H type-1 domain-containing protein n=1 Tax=Cuscuta campestris TaxID=132261 RepID=A0A484LHY7_9ASTE|nr:unnamed protein product [Cuscuta campestris]